MQNKILGKALAGLLTVFYLQSAAQDLAKSWHFGFLGGMVNYQGDLQPNSFSFQRSKFLGQLWVRKHFHNKIAVRSGISLGNITAADKYNRDYLQIRNLSFNTSIKEAFLNLEVSLLDINRTRWTPYGYGGLVAFHFNPYTHDAAGNKYYLKPLSTEGQGLATYPDRKSYKLTQLALGFGGGFRFMASEGLTLGLELSQRKTFTDYLDDVSSSYVDREDLFAAKGAKAVELAFRGNELNPNAMYPLHGEQRGTPNEMDWYYFMGLSVEVNLSNTINLFSFLSGREKGAYYRKCPNVF